MRHLNTAPWRRSVPAAIACALLLAGSAATAMRQRGSGTSVAARVFELSRETRWRLVSSTPVRFTTHHPQGMVKIGETFFVSSVEIRRATTRFAVPVGGYDRDAGEGVGHLFKFDGSGRLIADLVLGEGTMYHPGGIDYDGTHIWVSVAEYRPNSRTIVYRVDPDAMKAAEVFRWADHIGAVVHDTDGGALHGVSWGSRRFYRWPVDTAGRVLDAGTPPEQLARANPSHYVDYQDCKYAGGRRMLCSGVTELRTAPGAAPFRLGGLELVDLGEGRPLHQVPVLLWTPAGMDMTHNPSWFEATDTGLRAYFMPEDDKSTVYVYETEPDRTGR